MKKLRRIIYSLLVLWFITLGTSLVADVKVLQLNHSNKERIQDIQDSRVISCRKTYESFPEMFRPFFPPNPKKWTKAQRKNWDKLQARATELSKKCSQQTKP